VLVDPRWRAIQRCGMRRCCLRRLSGLVTSSSPLEVAFELLMNSPRWIRDITRKPLLFLALLGAKTFTSIRSSPTVTLSLNLYVQPSGLWARLMVPNYM
jgi:hypothetical protein